MHVHPTTDQIHAGARIGSPGRLEALVRAGAWHHHATKLPIALAVAALTLASTSFQPSAANRRGRALEGSWHGLQVCLGLEPSAGQAVWVPRLLLAVAVLVATAIAAFRLRDR